jgi:hypothetical protein
LFLPNPERLGAAFLPFLALLLCCWRAAWQRSAAVLLLLLLLPTGATRLHGVARRPSNVCCPERLYRDSSILLTDVKLAQLDLQSF